MGLIADYIKRGWEQEDREALQQQVQGIIGQAPSPQFQQMSQQGVPVEQYVAQSPMDVRAGTGAMTTGQLDVGQLARGLIGIPETQQIGAQMLRSAMPSPVKPTGLMQNIQAAGVDLQTPAGQKIMLDILKKPSTQVNLSQVKPLADKAANWTNDQGEQPDPRMSVTEAAQMGYRPTTAGQRKDIQAASAAVAPLGQMIKWGFGKDDKEGLFPPESTGLIGRVAGGASSYLAGKAGSDEATTLYQANQEALVTALARLVGQVGTLTDRDVDTVRGLFPTAGFTPRNIAKAKFKSIATLLLGKGVPAKQLEDMGFPEWAFEAKELSDDDLRAIAEGK